MLISNTQPSMAIKKCQIKAFTLLESLLVLAIMSLLILGLSGSVQTIFERVEDQLFFLEFEHFYVDSQKLAVASSSSLEIDFSPGQISNGYTSLSIPKQMTVTAPKQLKLEENGGNNSLTRISFKTAEKTVNYQLYLGSGRYKKTED